SIPATLRPGPISVAATIATPSTEEAARPASKNPTPPWGGRRPWTGTIRSPNGQIIANRVERGDLVQAYKDAQDFLKRQPKNATAHFVTGYVLRYAGLLDESARECEAALSLDPGNYLFRACSFTFGEMGNEERAMDFIRLDAGSNFFNANV